MRKRSFLIELTGYLSRPYLVCDYCNAELMYKDGHVEKAYAVIELSRGKFWITSVICPDCRQRAFRKFQVVAGEVLNQELIKTLNSSYY